MTSLFRGIGRRIFISFSILLVVLTLVLSAVGLQFAKNTIVDNASNELRVLSVVLSQQLTRYLKRIENHMKSLSSTGGYLDKELRRYSIRERKIEEFLSGKLKQFGLLDAVAVFDLEGRCLVSTDPEWKNQVVQKEPFFINGLKHFSFAEVFETKDGDKVLLVAAPVGENEFVQGVLVGRVKLSSIYDLMGQQLSLSESTEAFLLDSKLRFITPSKTAPDELLKSHLAETPLVHHLQDEFWVGKYDNYKGVEVLGTVLKMPTYHWYLAIERSFDEVEHAVNNVKKAFLGATAGILLALILVTYFLTKSITKPLESLVGEAQRIAAGDLTEPLKVLAGTDEISFLASEFEKMRARIAASQGKLIEQLAESERLAAIGTLASSLAHEIRNPLNAVNLLLTQLERSRGPDELRAKMIENMRGEIGRLDRLVSDILDYAKPLQLHRERFDLRDFISEVVEFYRAIFDKKRIALRLDFPNQLIEIEADRDKLRQAFVNLIQNSIDAMENSGGDLVISVEKHWQSIRVSVKDSGVGIAESARGRLFDLFFTTKEKGTGLGLSTVRKITDAHRGRIEISSQPGKGTTVTLNLPA